VKGEETVNEQDSQIPAQPLRSTVAVLKTEPETVLDDYTQLMRLAEFEKHLDKNAPVILKDNISWHLMFPGANTTPWQLEAVIRTLLDAGYKELICVQNQTVVTNAFKGEALNKYLGVLEKYNIPVLYNFRPQDMKWIRYQPKAKMLVLDKIFPEGILIPDFFPGKNVLHLPTVKCHIYTTMTGAMKNAFGGLLNTRRHYTHSVIHETLVDLLNIQKEIHAGIFTVMDGTTCGNGPGPRTMIPVIKDYLLASGDSVAIDAISAKLMGFDPMSLKKIRLATEAGLGTGILENINVVGADNSQENFGFTVGDNAASTVGDMLWFGPLKWLQHLMFHTPLVYFFIWGSFVYHDFIWYPNVGKPIVQDWMKTKWGQLFQKYE